MTYKDIETLVRKYKLKIYGAFYPKADDQIDPLIKTLMLLGPDEPGFWNIFTSSTEWVDGETDPMDKWSYRIISKIARETDATPYFPFGPKRHPFYQWAIRTGSAWASPVSLLVHKDVGLMVSYRGALGFQIKLDVPTPVENPCKICDQPCVQACPISALSIKGYDVKKCKQFLTTEENTYRLSQGCSVRTSCPLSKTLKRHPKQSEYHMSVFKAASIK